MMRTINAAVLLLALTACDATPSSNAPAPIKAAAEPAPAPTPTAPRFDPVAVEKMQQELKDLPGVADLVFTDDRRSVEWQVGVAVADGPAIDLARIVCRKLQGASLSDQDTDVRIVDLWKLERSGGDFRGASLAHVACPTGDSLGL